MARILGLSIGETTKAVDSYLDLRSVPPEVTRLALDAFERYGKGHHPAGLNFGDCFSYALAALTGEPLLFKGEDFSKTDLAKT